MSIMKQNTMTLTFLTGQVSEQCYGLYSFPESHLIRQYTIEAFLVHRGQPVETNVLVLSQGVA